MEPKQEYQRKMEAQIEKIQSQIDELKVKASLAKADAKDAYQEQIDTLNSKYSIATSKLEQLKDSSGNAWEEMKTGLERAWGELQDSFNKASTHFK